MISPSCLSILFTSESTNFAWHALHSHCHLIYGIEDEVAISAQSRNAEGLSNHRRGKCELKADLNFYQTSNERYPFMKILFLFIIASSALLYSIPGQAQTFEKQVCFPTIKINGEPQAIGCDATHFNNVNNLKINKYGCADAQLLPDERGVVRQQTAGYITGETEKELEKKMRKYPACDLKEVADF